MYDENLVSVNIMGGLGNQMFQLAAAYAYTKKYNGKLIIKSNKIENDGRPTYWNTILDKFQPYLVESIPKLKEWHELGATEYNEIPPINNGLHIKGYLQSPKYFQEFKQEIQEIFKPNNYIISEIKNKYHPLINNRERVVVVHARRTDYLKNQDIINFHGPLSIEYYKVSIQKMYNLVKNPIFLLVSDDPKFWVNVINEIPELNSKNMYILDNENEINTFALLQQFNYFIIANSTFSWWAAWLSNDVKKVIAPSKWFGPTGPKNYKDIYISEWELI